jgi:hypothetical protein
MLYSMHDTPLFLQPQMVAHGERTPSYYMLDAQLVLFTQKKLTANHSLTHPLTHTKGTTEIIVTFVMFINFKHKRQVYSLYQLRFANIITHLYAETVWQSCACDQS